MQHVLHDYDFLRLGGKKCGRYHPIRIHIWVLQRCLCVNRYQSLSDFNIHISVIGLLGPMLAVLAKNDSEIGERLGICYSLTGTWPEISSNTSTQSLTESAFGGLIGNGLSGLFFPGDIFFQATRLLERSSRRHILGGNQLCLLGSSLDLVRYASPVLVSFL